MIMDPNQICGKVDALLEFEHEELDAAKRDLRKAILRYFSLMDKITAYQDAGRRPADCLFTEREADIAALEMRIAQHRHERKRAFTRDAYKKGQEIKKAMSEAETLFFSDDLAALWNACCIASAAEEKYFLLLKGAFRNEN